MRTILARSRYVTAKQSCARAPSRTAGRDIELRCPDGTAHRPCLIRLHDFADEDVELSVFLFAYFGDLIGPHLVAVHHRPLRRRRITTRKFHNDRSEEHTSELQSQSNLV